MAIGAAQSPFAHQDAGNSVIGYGEDSVRHIIVDGYNVIRADPRLQSFERDGLEKARDVLVRTLSSSPRLARDQITVVFDGTGGTRGHVHAHTVGRVRVVYSARGQTADEVIICEAAQLSGRGQVIVVTNDGEVRDRCRSEGCDVSGSENLLEQLPGRTGRLRSRNDGHDDPDPSLSTVKRGNPRRSPRRGGRRDIRF
jgi:predicted RNA-binding protein with PIN domain